MSDLTHEKNRRSRLLDIGEVAVATALLAFVLWHFFVTYQASARVTNLLMVLPGTGLFGVLWAAIVWKNGFADRNSPPAIRGPVSWKIPALMIAFGLYVLALPVLGLDVGTGVFVAATLILLGERNITAVAIYSICLGAVIGLLMGRGLSVGAPTVFF